MEMRVLRSVRTLGSVTCLSLLFVGAAANAQDADSLSPAEKIYADLAKLPPAERAAKIEAGARQEGHISIIQTLRGVGLGNDQIDLFRKHYPFLNVSSTDTLGSPEATERLLAEEVARNHLTDAVNVAAVDLNALINHNLLARYETPMLAAILPQYRQFADPQNRWTLSFWTDRGVIYNTNLVPPDMAPKQWMDLCNPFFKGNFSFDPVQARFIAGLYVTLGERYHDFVRCVGQNKPIISRGVSQRVTLMLAGDHMVVADSYPAQAIEAQRKNPATPAGFMKTPSVIASFGAVAINRNTRHPYASALFTDWMLSDEAQQVLVKFLRGPVTEKHPYLPDGTEVVAPELPGPVMDRLVAEWGREVEGRK